MAPPAELPCRSMSARRSSTDVGWSSYLTAGTATLAIREKKPSYGSVAYYAVAEGRATGLVAALYHVYYKADTLLDVYSLLPQRRVNLRRRGAPAAYARDPVRSGEADSAI